MEFISNQDSNINFDKYIIIPNHIHLIIILQCSKKGERGNSPLHKIIGRDGTRPLRLYINDTVGGGFHATPSVERLIYKGHRNSS